MAAIVDDYLESPMENDDVFPCKGCGEVRFSSELKFTILRHH